MSGRTVKTPQVGQDQSRTAARGGGGGMADRRPQADAAMRLQAVANSSARTTNLGAMQSIANQGKGKLLASSTKEPSAEQKEKYANARQEQDAAVDEMRTTYRGEISAAIGKEADVASGEGKTPSARFESAAWAAINTHLPLLHTLPFDTSRAAIRFAQDLMLKHVRHDPELIGKEDLPARLAAYLEVAAGNLKIDEDATEDADDVQPEDVLKEMKERKNDKRYLEALRRTKPKADDGGAEHTQVSKTQKLHQTGEEARFKEQEDLYMENFKERPQKAREDILARAHAMPLDEGTRFLILLNRHHAGQGSATAFIEKLSDIYDKHVKMPTHNEKRKEEAKSYRELGLMKDPADLSGPMPEDIFHSGMRSGRHDPFMDDVDEDMAKRRKAHGIAIKDSKALDDDARKKAVAERTAKEESAFLALGASVPSALIDKLKLVDPAVEKRSAASSALLVAAKSAHEKGAKAPMLLEQYEDYLALKNFPPGDKRRLALIAGLEAQGLLPGVDMEILRNGVRGIKAIHSAAQEGGWATKGEVDMASRMLGTAAFAGILDSHMRRGKPGPLRAMIEQITHHRELLIKHSPPLRSTSLVLDTNMVEMLVTPLDSLSGEPRKMRIQLNDVIARHHITDIRLANMNVAELSSVGRLIGTFVSVELNWTPGKGRKKRRGAPKKGVTRKLPVLGVPYHGSRGSGKYAEVFKKMEEKKVGENKGNADRSMMADLFMAEREQGAVAHFATADLGVAEEIGTKEHQFNPADMGLPKISVHTITQDRPKKVEPAGDELPVAKRRSHKIWSFPVGNRHRVRDIAKLITDQNFEVLVVGGAVRDFVRKRGAINDVDMKTNMPVDMLVKVMQDAGLTVSVTPAINLVTVGQDEASADIVSTSASHTGKEPVPKLDLEKDAHSRDFTLNALYLAPPKPNEKVSDDPLDPVGGAAHAASGLLQFTADPGPKVPLEEREKAILAHLSEKPENFGRALKFIQRGQKEWLAAEQNYRTALASWDRKRGTVKRGKKGRRAPQLQKPQRENVIAYHFEADILDMLRKHAMHILAPLADPHKGPHRKGLFIHQSGFKAPMELVDVMQRLHFPPEAVQMVYPDNVAGHFKDGHTAFNRAVTPRLRSVGPVTSFNAKAPPVVKVDKYTGHIYQYRIYAYTDAAEEAHRERLLIDVDYTDHDVQGHPSPHYHIYREVGTKWEKNEAGFSRTGQPGEPPISMVDGVRIYRGPTMWKWFGAEAHPDDPKLLHAQLKKAGAEAQVEIGDGDPVDIGGKIKLPMARIGELAKAKRLLPLLQVVHNLKAGHGWNASDDTVEQLTGSGGERLRFDSQVIAGVVALFKTCGIKSTTEIAAGGMLSEAARIRIFDLYNAHHSPELCMAASRYSLSRMKGHPDPFQFVDNFEFYVAALKHRVKHTQIARLHTLSIDHAAPHMAGKHAALEGKDYVEEVKKHADKLLFKDAGTAAYHLHKHLDMVSASFAHVSSGEKEMQSAGKAYIAKCRATVRDGALQKSVTETTTSIKLYFSKDSTVAIVEINTTDHHAHLLTCYNSEAAHETFLTTPADRADEKERSPGGGQPGTKKPGPNEPLQFYRTPFGAYARYETSDDGNCFFHAVRLSANLADSAAALRKKAVKELRTNYKRKFNGTVYTDFILGDEKRKAKMEKAATYLSGDGNWSRNEGDLVPELMAWALDRTIHILSRTTGNLIQTMGPPDRNPIVLFYDGGTHYERSQRI